MQGGIQRIGRVVLLGKLPIRFKDALEAVDNLGSIGFDAELAAHIKCTAIDVHRTSLGVDPIHQDELAVQFEIFLPTNFHTKTLQNSKGREGVVDVPIGDAPLSAAEQAHLHTTLAGRNNPLKNHGIHKFGVLNPQALVGKINDAGHLAPAMHTAPDQSHSEVWMEELPVPISFKTGNHLLHQGR